MPQTPLLIVSATAADFLRTGSGASPPDGHEDIGSVMVRLQTQLKQIDPDVDADTLLLILRETHRQTGGRAHGLGLIQWWFGKSPNYPGESQIEAQWKSCSTEAICLPANADDPAASELSIAPPIDVLLEATREPVTADASDQAEQPTFPRNRICNALDQYSLRGHSQELEKSIVAKVYVLKPLALKGQSTAIFARPNVGKTVITVAQLIEAIVSGRIDPDRTYYFNVDDTGSGLVEKNAVAEEHNFHMLTEGRMGFKTSAFLSLMSKLVHADQAREVVIILDTGKHFVNLMDKMQASQFTKAVRAFVMKGGTLILLAHVNKKPGIDGRPIYAGTSDLVDDFDCAYTMAPSPSQPNAAEKIVVFENIKRRGDNEQTVTFGYSVERGISYSELLASVRLVEESETAPPTGSPQPKSDADAIDTVRACIVGGINTKMLLASEVAKRTGLSKRRAVQIIERYTGDDAATHHWKFSVGGRGVQRFVLLQACAPDPSSEPAGS